MVSRMSQEERDIVFCLAKTLQENFIYSLLLFLFTSHFLNPRTTPQGLTKQKPTKYLGIAVLRGKISYMLLKRNFVTLFFKSLLHVLNTRIVMF